jgi:hypothetical protein
MAAFCCAGVALLGLRPKCVDIEPIFGNLGPSRCKSCQFDLVLLLNILMEGITHTLLHRSTARNLRGYRQHREIYTTGLSPPQIACLCSLLTPWSRQTGLEANTFDEMDQSFLCIFRAT